MTRHQSSLIFQIRSGHFPVNVFLHRINKSDTSICQKCNAEDEVQEETISHFLFECTAYTRQRRDLARAIGHNNLDLRNIMAQSKRMKALAKYIVKTGRLVTP